jgi:hypothetical protein
MGTNGAEQKRRAVGAGVQSGVEGSFWVRANGLFRTAALRLARPFNSMRSSLLYNQLLPLVRVQYLRIASVSGYTSMATVTVIASALPFPSRKHSVCGYNRPR